MVVGAIAACVAPAAGQGRYDMKLWGMEGHSARAFAITDLERPSESLVQFGALHYMENGRLTPVGGDLEAFTVVEERRAYAAIDRAIGDLPAPTLLEIDLRALDSGGPMIGRVRGSLAPGAGAGPFGRVTGVAGDPVFGTMYLAVADGDPETPDMLFRARGMAAGDVRSTPVGFLHSGDDSINSVGDIGFGPAGRLLITDGHGRRVMLAEPESGAITDAGMTGGPSGSASLTSVAWDVLNSRLAAFDAGSGSLLRLGAGAGDTATDLTAFGISDVRGMGFVLQSPILDAADLEEIPRAANVDGGMQRDAAPASAEEALGGGGPARGGGGGGGGDSSDGFEFDPFPDADPPVDGPAEDDPADDDPTGEDFDDGDPNPDPDPDPPPDDDPNPDGDPDPTPQIPAPATLAVLSIAGLAASRRRRN